MLKFAATTILDARMAPAHGQMSLLKDAHRHEFNYTPKHGMLYVRSRMISSRCNDNYDEFPAEEIEKGWRSFIGKPVFVNHHNDDHRRARGVIIDAALHRDFNPDGSPDTWVEGLQEIDALTFPKLAKAILAGHIERTSMGVDVKHSICTACNNKAQTPMDYCQHVPGMKGKQFYKVTASGHRTGTLIREKCYGLGFFENSLLVEEPADPTAYTLGKPVAGPGLEHLMAGLSLTASKITPPNTKISTSELFPEEWPMGPRHVVPVDPRAFVTPEPVRYEPMREASLKLTVASQCLACRCRDTVANSRGEAECWGCGHSWHEGTKQAMLQAEAAKYNTPDDHPWFQQHPVDHKNIVDHWNDATPDEKASGKNWYSDAHLVAKSIAKLAPKREGKKESDPDARHPQGDNHLGAGALAIYSPQQGWAGNMHNAARVLHEGHGIGGKGSGMFASGSQKKSADRLLGGEHYNDVLAGPKIRDFAHLIEHGGDKDPEVPHVVVDRHALGVAAGKALTNEEYSAAPLSGTKRKDGTLNRKNYDHVVGKYHEAAAHISKQEGEPIAGHQVQAVTWLVRQRKNQEAERSRAAGGADSRLDKGREKSRSNAEQGWNDFRTQHMPDMEHGGPGTGYQASRKRGGASFRNAPVGAPHVAYGETKAPAQVDTLRDENCPICGEQDAWDSNSCAVCGFVAPPKAFQDPDLEMAQKIDLRKQQDDFNDAYDPKAIDPDGMAGGDVQPDLVCDNCGTEFPAGEPETTDTSDPQAGDEAIAGTDEGDVCPACGKGILETGTDLEAEEGAGAVPPDEGGDEPVPGDEAVPESDEDEEDPGPVDPRDLADPDEDPDGDGDSDKPDDSGDDDSDKGDDDKKKPAKGKPNPFKK